MSLAGIGRFYKNMMKGNYQMGRRLTETLTRNMSPNKAKTIGGIVDVVAGAGLTYFFGLSTLGYVAAGAAAAASILTLAAPAAIPAALLTIGVSALFGTMGSRLTAAGVGFLAAAKDKIHLPSPKVAVVGVGHAVGFTAHAVAKPIKWTAHKLRHPFNNAHDGDKKGPQNDPPNSFRPKPGRHKL